MTAQGKTFNWWLWPTHETQRAAIDEFVAVAEGFRIRLMGTTLELSFEASGTCSPDSARALAVKYVEALSKRLVSSLSLITEAEFCVRTEPPLGHMTMFPHGRLSRSEVATAVREARNEVLASEDKTLRRCYDYLQTALERPHTVNDEAAYDAYMALEVLEKRFGDEKKAIAALGKIFKKAKKAANAKRHIPEKFKQQPKPPGGALELTRQVIRKYERYLLDHP